ncbi:MAG: prolipoprotein diacylglyceryl transferase [Thermoleophilia bacterium]|nr:prolipoprotein diacylglyceryl transferase [Thermoleophilia bacterium]
MRPILATLVLGDTTVTLSAYATFYVLAWVAALLISVLAARRRKLHWGRALLAYGLALVAGLVGARLLDLAVNWNYYATNLAQIYALRFRGFALYGGLVAAVAVGILVARRLSMPIWKLADAALPGLAAGIMLMRIGCFLNGCCFGRATSLPWGVSYPPGSRAWTEVWASQLASGQTTLPGLSGPLRPVHPTQIYEALAAVVLLPFALFLARLLRRRVPLGSTDGAAFLVFALGFTLFRLANHFLRVLPANSVLPSWFYPCLYVLLSFLSAILLAQRLTGQSTGRLFRGRASQISSHETGGPPTHLTSSTCK